MRRFHRRAPFSTAVLMILAIGGCGREEAAPTSRRDTPKARTAASQRPGPPAAPRRERESPDRGSTPVAVRPRAPSNATPDPGPGTLHLKVVGVHDGDTLTGIDKDKVQHKIRLDAIDAPELGQPYGQAAKKALSEKVFGREVVVIPKTEDKYGRTIGHVLVDGRDVNLELIEEGMAWHYEQYDHNQRLRDAERSAREAARGLWRGPDPEAPWDHRREQRHEKRAGAGK